MQGSQPPGKPWKILEFEDCPGKSWKILEFKEKSAYCPGKSWNLQGSSNIIFLLMLYSSLQVPWVSVRFIFCTILRILRSRWQFLFHLYQYYQYLSIISSCLVYFSTNFSNIFRTTKLLVFLSLESLKNSFNVCKNPGKSLNLCQVSWKILESSWYKSWRNPQIVLENPGKSWNFS